MSLLVLAAILVAITFSLLGPVSTLARGRGVGDASTPVCGGVVAIHRPERHRVGNRRRARCRRLPVPRRLRSRGRGADGRFGRWPSPPGSRTARRPRPDARRGFADRPVRPLRLLDGPHDQVEGQASPAVEPAGTPIVRVPGYRSHRRCATGGLLPPGTASQDRDQRGCASPAQRRSGARGHRARAWPRARAPRTGHAPDGGVCEDSSPGCPTHGWRQREIATLLEMSADDYSARRNDPVSLAAALVRMATSGHVPNCALGAAGNAIPRRVDRLLAESRNSKRTAVATGLLAGVIVLSPVRGGVPDLGAHRRDRGPPLAFSSVDDRSVADIECRHGHSPRRLVVRG